MIPMCKTMDVLNDEKTSKDIQSTTNSPPATKHDPNYTTTSDTHKSTFNQSPFNIDDDIPSSCPKLLDWNQYGPPNFYRFDNDDSLVTNFKTYEGIKIGDNKEAIYPKVNTLAYFGEPTPPSSFKEKREKNDKSRSLGENQKVPLDCEK